jgi:CRISPR-associated protein Cas2
MKSSTTRYYVISYDISDDKRRTRVFDIVQSWGNPLQFSVFEAELSSRQLAMMETELDRVIHHAEDQVLIFDMGPVTGSTEKRVRYVGRTWSYTRRSARVF